MASVEQWVKFMTPKDKQFYLELGQRIAQFRKAQNLTQQQLAESLGVAQQTLAHYEGGRLRIAVASLPPLAKVLQVSIEELISGSATGSTKRGPASKLQRQIELIRQLPRTKQKFVTEMLDTVLQQAH